MCHHNHRLIFASAESLDHFLYPPTIIGVQAMKRFIQNQQFRIFDELLLLELLTLFELDELLELDELT